MKEWNGVGSSKDDVRAVRLTYWYALSGQPRCSYKDANHVRGYSPPSLGLEALSGLEASQSDSRASFASR